MSPVLRYHTGGGVYTELPGNIEEVTVSPNQPPVNTDLWVDTDDQTGGTAYLLSGFRNYCRNGDMSVAQRGDGSWVNGAGYKVDGWSLGYSGGTLTQQRMAQGPAGSGSPWLYTQISGQSTAGHYAYIAHPIEDVIALGGKTITVSFDAVSISGAPKIGVEFVQNFGSGGSASVYTSAGAVTISSTVKYRHTVTFTPPSIVGKTFGSGSYSALNLWLSSGSTNDARASGIGIQNNTFYITDIQLEEGGVATPFEKIPAQQQLAWCQRYFWRHGSDNPHNNASNDYVFGYGYGLSATRCDFFVDYPATMRVVPSVAFSSQTSGFCVAKGTAVYQPITSANTARLSANRAELYLFVASGLTADAVYTGARFSSTAAYIDFSAEL